MLRRSRFVVPGTVVTLMLGLAHHAHAQVSLPEVAIESAPLASDTGLTIVDGTFAPVTVIDQNQIRRSGAGSLGDLLFGEPGITGSGYAPGAASRPIIRGLDNNRVKLQENGVGVGDVSDLGEDHAVPLDPFSAQQIEIIRGPAALRYGSQAIGGVVNVINNKIPMPTTAEGVSGQVTSGFTTGTNGVDGGIQIDARKNNIAFHAEAFGRSAGDYAIPGGQQINSYSRPYGFALGSSVFFDHGYAGISISQINALYGIPGKDAATDKTRIAMMQTKIQSKGEYRPESGPFAVMRYWAGASFYRHSEQDGSTGAFVDAATFRNTEFDARFEGQTPVYETKWGSLSHVVGFHIGAQSLGTFGDATGLLYPADSRTAAGYYFGELGLTKATRLQWAGRLESATVSGTASNFPADYLGASGAPVEFGLTRSFLAQSAGLGLRHDLGEGWVASVNLQYTERSPRAAELFSRGPHDATRTFEIGNPDLSKEAARSVEIGLKKAQGSLRVDATGHFASYKGFIYKQLTGAMCDDTFASCGTGTELSQVVYRQADAVLYGTELKAQYDLLQTFDGTIGIEGQYDFVRAQFADGSNLPRIPPHRLGGGFYYRSDVWFARINLLHAFDQLLTGPNETSSPGYNLLNADISYKTRLQGVGGKDHSELTLGLSARNLLNERIINHVSFNKDDVVQPGRSLRFYATVKF